MTGILVVLAALCIVLPGRVTIGGTEVRWPTLTQVFEAQTEEEIEIPEELWNLDDPEEEASDTASISLPTDSVTPPAPPVVPPKVVVDSTTDSRIFLSRFYASLQTADSCKVRIVHYGDSQIEEDRITQQIRETLQQRYGGSGVGLMPLLQTIPSLTVRQELRMNGRLISASQAQQGPARYLVYGPKSMQRTDGLYGAMGQVAIMADSAKRWWSCVNRRQPQPIITPGASSPTPPFTIPSPATPCISPVAGPYTACRKRPTPV